MAVFNVEGSKLSLITTEGRGEHAVLPTAASSSSSSSSSSHYLGCLNLAANTQLFHCSVALVSGKGEELLLSCGATLCTTTQQGRPVKCGSENNLQ